MYRLLVILCLGVSVSVTSCNSDNADSSSGEDETNTTVDTTSMDEVAIADSSNITCPVCGYQTREELPTEYCLFKYTCKKCGEELHPKEGDCCVFCTYGDAKCPSIQEEEGK